MGELGEISGVAHSGAAANGPAQYAVQSLSRASATGIINDDAAAAMMKGAGMQTAEGRQSPDAADPGAALDETMREFVEAVREKMAKLMELFEQIAAGPFSRGHLAKNFREQAEALNRILDVLWENAMVTSISAMGMPSPSAGSRPRGCADTGQALTAFKEELEQVSSSKGFLLGASAGTDQINTDAQFGLGQIADVQQNMTEMNANLEVGIFSLARVREQAMKALCSAALQPERVLFLLQDP